MRNVATQEGQPPAERQPTADHAGLLPMLEALERAGEGEAIAHLLAELGEFLTTHFAREESPGGFFDSVASRHALRVARLREEHPMFLETIARLRADIAAQGERVAPNLLRKVADLIAALRRHEAVEENLLVDSMERDIGGGK